MGIITTRVGVTLTATELAMLDTLRLVFGPHVSRASALRLLVVDRHRWATIGTCTCDPKAGLPKSKE